MRILTCTLILCASLACTAQEHVESVGINIGYNVVPYNHDAMVTWLEDFHEINTVVDPLELPSLLTGFSVGIAGSFDDLDIGVAFSMRNAKKRVTLVDVNGVETDRVYKYKFNLLQLPEVVVFPFQPFVGIGGTLDAGQFKVSLRDTDNRFFSSHQASWMLGHQAILRLRLPLESASLSFSGYYQFTYWDVGWDYFEQNDISFQPRGFGFRVNLQLPFAE